MQNDTTECEVQDWWPPASCDWESPAESLLAELLLEHHVRLIGWLDDTFECAAQLPQVYDCICEPDMSLKLLSALHNYKRKGDTGELAHLPDVLVRVVREPPKTPIAVIECKTELLISALMTWWAHSQLMDGELDKATRSYGEAREALGGAAAIAEVLWGEEWITAVAKRGAVARLQNDQRQLDKRLVRDCWTEWQRQPHRYAGKAAFARDMLEKFESLRSQPVIEGWCRQWEKESAG